MVECGKGAAGPVPPAAAAASGIDNLPRSLSGFAATSARDSSYPSPRPMSALWNRPMHPLFPASATPFSSVSQHAGVQSSTSGSQVPGRHMERDAIPPGERGGAATLLPPQRRMSTGSMSRQQGDAGEHHQQPPTVAPNMQTTRGGGSFLPSAPTRPYDEPRHAAGMPLPQHLALAQLDGRTANPNETLEHRRQSVAGSPMPNPFEAPDAGSYYVTSVVSRYMEEMTRMMQRQQVQIDTLHYRYQYQQTQHLMGAPQPIIIQNRTEVAASAEVEAGSAVETEAASTSVTWAQSFFGSRTNQLMFLSGAVVLGYVVREHLRQSWHMERLQRRIDTSVLLKIVKFLEDSLTSKIAY
eukprot:GHVU01202401.1.p1 GENE.GHVU01202401.1~~GHVU01202401.1.p1  ORF type:complete len:354 (+),score=32.27 GHVU01202401.1:86-1147(+)